MDESLPVANAWPVLRQPLTLSPDVVHLVRLRLDLSKPDYTRLREYLSEDEIERADRFRFDEPRLRFVGCRATLRMLIGQCCGLPPTAIEFCYGLHGKPEMVSVTDPAAASLKFNVSHSGDLGLLGITRDATVGVDVEQHDPAVRMLDLAKRYFTPQEAAELSQLPGEKQMAGFYQGWTCKEAYLKATGRGMSLPLGSFSVVINPDRPAALEWVSDQPDEPRQWKIQAIDIAPGYSAAVMVAKPGCQIATWHWSID